jgi:hypothetical protein
MTVAAGMSIQSPFLRIPDGATSAKDVRGSLINLNGDPFTMMDAFHLWISTKADGRQSSRDWCRERFIQEQRLYELAKLRQQFHETLEGLGFHTDSHSTSRDPRSRGEFVVVWRCLLFEQEHPLFTIRFLFFGHHYTQMMMVTFILLTAVYYPHRPDHGHKACEESGNGGNGRESFDLLEWKWIGRKERKCFVWRTVLPFE